MLIFWGNLENSTFCQQTQNLQMTISTVSPIKNSNYRKIQQSIKIPHFYPFWGAYWHDDGGVFPWWSGGASWAPNSNLAKKSKIRKIH